MNETASFKCHKICGGSVEGEALISREEICFYLVDAETGKVVEKNHDLEGRNVSGKIMIFPGGKGSSVVQGDGLYMLKKRGTAPKAIILQHPDTVLVTAAIVMKIPLVDRVEEGFYEEIENGDHLRVDADEGSILLYKETGRPHDP